MTDLFCQDLLIPCSEGMLEGRLAYREVNNGKPGVILCPPHPLLAGNMDNNVITAIAEQLSEHFPVLTFNYRAVGKSFKTDPDLPLFEYWNNLDKGNTFSEIIADTEQLIQWSKSLFTDCHLLGYSFGAYVALSAFPQSALSFTAVTPPLEEHDFKSLEKISSDTCLIFAGNDGLLTTAMTNFASGIVKHELAGCDHFFLGREEEVARLVETFLLSKSM